MMPYTNRIERTVTSSSPSLTRTVWTSPPAARPTRTALVFLDGELYLERVLAEDVVRRLEESLAIPAVASVFVSNHGAAARHQDFVCSPAYAEFVATHLVDFVRCEHPGVSQFVLVGLSLSGLMAAYVATRYPDTFPTAICQSPSLWWDRGRFGADLPPASRPGQRLWICVGNQETATGVTHAPSGLLQEISQVAGCESATAALRAKGYTVQYREYDGGHDPDCWRDDLALALPWALTLAAG